MTTEEIENRFNAACGAIGAALANFSHPLITEIARLQAENAELTAGKSGQKGVEEFYAMRQQRDEWRTLAASYELLFTGAPTEPQIARVRSEFDKLNAKYE